MMETIGDFEDMLGLLYKHRVRYLIIGGLAFIYHVKPRYTKDMDLWIDPAPENVKRANNALSEFGSPYLLDTEHPSEILQLGVAPDRIDFLRHVKGARRNCLEKTNQGSIRRRQGLLDRHRQPYSHQKAHR